MPSLRFDRLHPAHLDANPLDVAVVIDVLRATTTAIELLGRGIPRLLILADPSELGHLPADGAPGFLIFSELRLPSSPHEQVDNSPSVASRVELDGRTPVLVTTNGTKAVRAALSRARVVFLASFANVRAAAEMARSAANHRVTALPAGHFDKREIRTEDEVCAGVLLQLLEDEPCDIEAAAASCFEDDRVRRRIAREPGFLEDAERALRLGNEARVPHVALIKLSGHDLIEVRPYR